MPLGFNAKRDDGDEIEWRYDPKALGYRFSKWWDDKAWDGKDGKWIDKRRVLANGMFSHQQHFNLKAEARKWSDAGWTVTIL